MYVVNVCREKGALVASYILAAAVCPLVYTLMMAFILYMYAMAAAPAILGCDGLKVSRACMADRRAFSPRVKIALSKNSWRLNRMGRAKSMMHIYQI